MPVMDGFSYCRQAKEVTRNKLQAPIIIAVTRKK
jgi:CheY-like chemotaxis protein